MISPPLLSSGKVHVVENFSSILTGLQGAVQLETNFRSEGAVAKQVHITFSSLIAERTSVVDVKASGSQPSVVGSLFCANSQVKNFTFPSDLIYQIFPG